MKQRSEAGFYVDSRLGGTRRLIYCHPEELMRVSDELLDCVCFLGTEESSGRLTVRGTAFFISYPAERVPNGQFTYLITARHNIQKAAATGDSLVLRVNTDEDKAETVHILNLAWHYPDNPASDVAVSAPLGNIREQGVRFRTLPRSMFATEETIETESIGVGDELLSTGLFAHHYGQRKNVPIIRSGIISAMPGEPLVDQASGEEYLGYLAEIRSIGGLSGSPVFVRLGIGRQVEASVSMNKIRVFLIGLIRGHWKQGAYGDADFGESELESLNSGIAIVTPITEALAVLQREDFVTERKRQEREHLRKHAPTQDSVEVAGDSEFERFEDLTRNLMQVSKTEIDEERKREDK